MNNNNQGNSKVKQWGLAVGVILALIIGGKTLKSFSNTSIAGDRVKIPEKEQKESNTENNDEKQEEISEELWRNVQITEGSYFDSYKVLMGKILKERAVRWIEHAQRMQQKKESYIWLQIKYEQVTKELKELTKYGSIQTNTKTYSKFITLINKQAALAKALALSRNTPPPTGVPINNHIETASEMLEASRKYTNPALRNPKDYRR